MNFQSNIDWQTVFLKIDFQSIFSAMRGLKITLPVNYEGLMNDQKSWNAEPPETLQEVMRSITDFFNAISDRLSSEGGTAREQLDNGSLIYQYAPFLMEIQFTPKVFYANFNFVASQTNNIVIGEETE